jgi:hypothetical protein
MGFTPLDEAAVLFENKKYKEAYSRVGQTVRLFLRYEQGLDREITNDEIIHHLKTHIELRGVERMF